MAECDATSTWAAFKDGMRRRLLPPDSEYRLRERLCGLSQTQSLHEYIAEFQNARAMYASYQPAGIAFLLPATPQASYSKQHSRTSPGHLRQDYRVRTPF